MTMPKNSPIALLKTRCARSFTNEEEKLFQRRFENGYDLLNDPRYISWLHIHHPEEAIRLRELTLDSTDSHSGESASSVERGKARERVEKSRTKRELLEEQDMNRNHNSTVTSSKLSS